MILQLILFPFMVSVLLASCASSTTRDPIDYRSRDFSGGEKERIIYRDLTVPKTASIAPASIDPKQAELARLTQQIRKGAAEPALAVPQTTAVVPTLSTKEPFYIPFFNESSVLPSEHLPVLRELVRHHKDGDHYVVMGHSHGQSLVGTARLAQRRAETVTNWMIQQGIDKRVIHQTASWSGHRDMLAPSKGVMVYVTGEQNGRYLLSLTPFDFKKESENEGQLAQTNI